jgi:hypothetical protein
LSLASTVGVLLAVYGLLLSLQREVPVSPLDPAPQHEIASLPEPQRLPHRANFEPAAVSSIRDQGERTASLEVTLTGALPAVPDAGLGVFTGDTSALLAWVQVTAFQGSSDRHSVRLQVPARRALALRWAANADAAARAYWSATSVAPVEEALAAELRVNVSIVRVEVTTDGTVPNAGALLRIDRCDDRSWRHRAGIATITDERGALQLELGDGVYEVRSAFDEGAAPVSFTVPGASEVRLIVPAPGVRAARS